MKDFVREFLFGSKGIIQDESGVRAEIAMDLRTEGWIGIPHGGISMGAVMDLFESLREARGSSGLPYPITINIRMGGSTLRTGETVDIAVAPEGEGAKGIVSVRGSALPYLEGGHHEDGRAKHGRSRCLPAVVIRPDGRVPFGPPVLPELFCLRGRSKPPRVEEKLSLV